MSPPTAVDVHVEGVTDTSSVLLPNPLSLEGIAAKRAKADPIPGGIAAYTSSDFFKSAGCFSQPKAKRFDHLLSAECKARKGSSLKGAAKYLKNPGLISLGGGLPSSDFFPFESIDLKVPTPPGFSEEETKKTGQVLHAGKHDIREGKSLYDLSVCLNYGQSTGSAQLLRFVTEHTEIVHHPPYADWQCTLTAGSTSALDMAYRMFCERGDHILAEEYTFATAVETAAPLGVKAASVKMDEQGILPSDLDDVLTNWDEKARGSRKPWVLYLIPSGQNPTGATAGEQRRRDVYKIAQKHDLIIFEDEPYYFLQMQPYTGPNAPDVPPPASHEAFIKALVPSYLSMDVDGRVLRLDSFSKVVAPGTRVGWLVGAEQLIERFTRHSEVSTQNPSGVSQMVLYKLLDEAWGHKGYLDWLINIRMEYTGRRDILCNACEEYLPKSVTSWVAPAAGMFHWIQISWKSHPLAKSGSSHAEVEDAIFLAAVNKGVLVSKGSWFRSGGVPDDKMFFRTTFAAASETAMAEAIKRFAEALRGEFGIEA